MKEILRNDLKVADMSSKVYTPATDDRGGFQIRCVDTINPSWKIKADTVAISITLFPKCKFACMRLIVNTLLKRAC